MTLCLRNTSHDQKISVLAVDYPDSQGQLLRQYLPAPQAVPPWGSLSFTVAESDRQGGSGASFVVR